MTGRCWSVATQVHVIVCGGGMAGLTAAVTALEGGARVTLLEKGSEVGGAALISGGAFWTWADFRELRRAVPRGDATLQQLVYDGLDAGLRWLQEEGVRLGPFEPAMPHGRGQTAVPRQAIDALLQRFTALHGELRLETSLDDLLVRAGRVIGVRAAIGQECVDLAADAVVLATGGFQGNPELISRYMFRGPGHVLLRGNPWSTGDALLAAERIGAALTPGMNHFYGHALAVPPAGIRKEAFREVSQYYGHLVVALNRWGVRFADESAGTGEEVLNQRLAGQPEGEGFYVCDRSVADMEARPGLITGIQIKRAVAAGAPVVRADTLEELCEALQPHGLQSKVALRTLNEFNAALVNGRADELLPPRGRNRYPLATPPYYGVKVKASITFSMGGLAVDESMCVLRRSGGSSVMAEFVASLDEYRATPIPGLWAAGCDVGNINHLGYVGALSTALVTGRIAGTGAAH